MNFATEQEAEVLCCLFERYKLIAAESVYDTTFDKCDTWSIGKLCDEAVSKVRTYPTDKLYRWLGFVQGVLAAHGMVEVDEEREFTRPLFHSLYDKPVETFDSSKN